MPTSTVLLYSLVGAIVLVYLPFLWVAYGRFRVNFDLGAPRASFDKLSPSAQRAVWAHQNSWEALIIFTAATLTAYTTGVDSPWATNAAIAFLVARLLYSVFYILDIPIWRSLMFGVGSACSITLFTLSLLTIG